MLPSDVVERVMAKVSIVFHVALGRIAMLPLILFCCASCTIRLFALW